MARSISILLVVLLLSGCGKNPDLTFKQKAMFTCVEACVAVIKTLPPYCSKEEYFCDDRQYVYCYTNICKCGYPEQELNCDGVSYYIWNQNS